jgi:hypothetical protein
MISEKARREEELEDAAHVRIFDQVKKSRGKAIPFDEAMAEIRRDWLFKGLRIKRARQNCRKRSQPRN